MDTADKRIEEFREVIYRTHYSIGYNVVDRYARRGVQSLAMTDACYLKRRVVALWPYRHGNIIGRAENRDKIHKAIKYLRELKRIYTAEAEGGEW